MLLLNVNALKTINLMSRMTVLAVIVLVVVK